MNKEVIKAINKKSTKIDKFNKWWWDNGYKVMRVILWYIWLPMLVWEKKIKPALDARNSWDEKRANEILSYYIPRSSDWVADKKEFYYFNNGYGWTPRCAKKYVKIKDRRFWYLNTSYGNGGKMRDYLLDEFELEGFTKTVRNRYDDFTEIVFEMQGE